MRYATPDTNGALTEPTLTEVVPPEAGVSTALNFNSLMVHDERLLVSGLDTLVILYVASVASVTPVVDPTATYCVDVEVLGTNATLRGQEDAPVVPPVATTTGETVIVAEALAIMVIPVPASSQYVVVAVSGGVTIVPDGRDGRDGTADVVPPLLLMSSAEGQLPLVVQESVDVPPGATVVGDAVKEVIEQAVAPETEEAGAETIWNELLKASGPSAPIPPVVG